MSIDEVLKEFDEKFTAFNNVYADKQELKDFIRQVYSQAEARGRENERERIDGFIEDIHTKWLDMSEVHELDLREKTVINILEDLLTKIKEDSHD